MGKKKNLRHDGWADMQRADYRMTRQASPSSKASTKIPTKDIRHIPLLSKVNWTEFGFHRTIENMLQPGTNYKGAVASLATSLLIANYPHLGENTPEERTYVRAQIEAIKTDLRVAEVILTPDHNSIVGRFRHRDRYSFKTLDELMQSHLWQPEKSSYQLMLISKPDIIEVKKDKIDREYVNSGIRRRLRDMLPTLLSEIENFYDANPRHKTFFETYFNTMPDDANSELALRHFESYLENEVLPEERLLLGRLLKFNNFDKLVEDETDAELARLNALPDAKEIVEGLTGKIPLIIVESRDFRSQAPTGYNELYSFDGTRLYQNTAELSNS